MSFAVERVMKCLKSDARCRLLMSLPSAHWATKMHCACFQFLPRLAVAAVPRLRLQCPHQKWAGVALAAVATANCDYALDALLQDTCLAIGDQKPICEFETSILTAVLGHKKLRCVG